MICIRNKELLIKFGERVKYFRTQKKISQQLLANNAEIEISQIYRIEKGKINPTLSTIGAIANALDIPINILMEL